MAEQRHEAAARSGRNQMKPIPKLNAAPGAVWPLPNEDTVKLKQIAAMAAALLVLGNGAATPDRPLTRRAPSPA